MKPETPPSFIVPRQARKIEVKVEVALALEQAQVKVALEQAQVALEQAQVQIEVER